MYECFLELLLAFYKLFGVVKSCVNTVFIINLEAGIRGSMAQKWAITTFPRPNCVRFGFSTMNYIVSYRFRAVLGGKGGSTLDDPNFGPILLARASLI